MAAYDKHCVVSLRHEARAVNCVLRELQIYFDSCLCRATSLLEDEAALGRVRRGEATAAEALGVVFDEEAERRRERGRSRGGGRDIATDADTFATTVASNRGDIRSDNECEDDEYDYDEDTAWYASRHHSTEDRLLFALVYRTGRKRIVAETLRRLALYRDLLVDIEGEVGEAGDAVTHSDDNNSSNNNSSNSGSSDAKPSDKEEGEDQEEEDQEGFDARRLTRSVPFASLSAPLRHRISALYSSSSNDASTSTKSDMTGVVATSEGADSDAAANQYILLLLRNVIVF